MTNPKREILERQVSNHRSLLQSYTNYLNNPTAEVLEGRRNEKVVNHIKWVRSLRHEYLQYLFCWHNEELDLYNIGDISVRKTLQNFINKKKDLFSEDYIKRSDYDELERRLKTTETFNKSSKLFNYTPDFCIILENVEEHPLIIIGDFSCRSNGLNAIAEKFEKYEGFARDLRDLFRVEFEFVNCSPQTGVLNYSNLERVVLQEEPTPDEILPILEAYKGEQHILSCLPPEDREDILERINTRDEYLKQEAERSADFAVKEEDFDYFLREHPIACEYMNERMGPDWIKEIRFLVDKFSYPDESENDMFKGAEVKEIYGLTDSDLDTKMEEHMNNINFPLKLNKVMVDDSYKKMELESSKHFKTLEKPKPLTPFVVTKRSRTFRNEGDTKFRTFKGISRVLIEEREIVSSDPKLAELAKIFKFHNLTDNEFKKLINHECSLNRDGRLVENKLDVERTERVRKSRLFKLRRLKLSKEEEQNDLESIKYYIPHQSSTVRINHRDEVFMPNLKEELSYWFNHCRVGYKSDLNKPQRDGSEQVESLPFWNDQFCDNLMLDYYNERNRMCKIALERGTNMMTDHKKRVKKEIEVIKEKASRESDKNRMRFLNEELNYLQHEDHPLLDYFGNRITKFLNSYNNNSDWDYESDDDSSMLSSKRSNDDGKSSSKKGYQELFKSQLSENSICDIIDSLLRSKDIKEQRRGKVTLECLILGLTDIFREIEVFTENLIYGCGKANKSIRIVTGMNSNQVGIIFPSDSVLNKDSQIPFITLGFIPKEDVELGEVNPEELFAKLDDHITVHEGLNHYIYYTKGHRFNKARSKAYSEVKSRFLVALSSLFEINLNDSSISNLPTSTAIMNLSLMSLNVSISTSSLLDNVRYMLENCLSGHSYLHDYITDKLMVASKNPMQIWVYRETKKLITSVSEAMSDVMMKNITLDEESLEVDLKSVKLDGVELPSLMDSRIYYRKPINLLNEVQILYFLCPKALHGSFHTKVKIHRTPIDFQEEINNYISENGVGCCRVFDSPGSRCTFSPEMIVRWSKVIENNVNCSRDKIRRDFLMGEKINMHPFEEKTMTSTKSALRKSDYIGEETLKKISERGQEKNGKVFMAGRFSVDMGFMDERLKAINEAHSPYLKKQLLSNLKSVVRQQLEDYINRDNAISINLGKDLRQRLDESLKKIVLSEVSGLVYWITNSKTDSKVLDLIDVVEDGTTIYRSGVVLTEMIRKVRMSISNRNLGSDSTIGKEAWMALMSDDEFVIAVRPKGQRTQDDREIYVVTPEMKICVYTLEHFYKVVAKNLKEEAISIPGDQKVIKMQDQVQTAISTFARWKRAEFNERMLNEELDNPHQEKNVYVLNFNLDMTKWAPKDLVCKFMYFTSASTMLKKKEKLFYVCMVMKYMEKRLYIDPELILKLNERLKSNEEILERSIADQCYNRDKERWRMHYNFVDTWCQGMLNYPSSCMHAAAMIDTQEHLKRVFGQGNVLSQINVHSDDNQCTFVVRTEKTYSETLKIIWNAMDYLTRMGCMEISKKKSNVSPWIKSFISQYNIGGEQTYPFVKIAMSSVSGLPHTSITEDIYSALSKVSSILSLGAPEPYGIFLSKLLLVQVNELWGLTKHGRCLVSEQTLIPKRFLPLCLGGFPEIDTVKLAILGPKAVDKETYYKLCKLRDAGLEKSPKASVVNNMIDRAIQLFIVCDLLTEESVEDDDYEGLDMGLKPFKRIQFLSKMTKIDDPFSDRSVQEREEESEKLLLENPTIMLRRPKEYTKQVKFFSHQYLQTSFRASLANQNPGTLRNARIINRNKGNFRLLKDTTIQVYKLESLLSEQDGRLTYNGEEVAQLLAKVLEELKIDNIMHKQFWSKFLKQDADFCKLSSCLRNTTKSIKKDLPNRFASIKPPIDSRPVILNPVGNLLELMFDKSLQVDSLAPSRIINDDVLNKLVVYKSSLMEDIRSVLTAFPFLEYCLRILSSLDNEYTNYDHYLNSMSPKYRESNEDIMAAMNSMMDVHRKLKSVMEREGQLFKKDGYLEELKAGLEKVKDNYAKEKETLDRLELKINKGKDSRKKKNLEQKANENRLKLLEQKVGTLESNLLTLQKLIDVEQNQERLRLFRELTGEDEVEEDSGDLNLDTIETISDLIKSLPETVPKVSNSQVNIGLSKRVLKILPSYLSKVVKCYKIPRNKVYFTFQRNPRSLEDLALSLKSVQNSSDGHHVEYFMNPGRSGKDLKQLQHDNVYTQEILDLKHAVPSLWNFYLLASRLAPDKETLRNVLLSMRHGNINVNTIERLFPKLPNHQKVRMIFLIFASLGNDAAERCGAYLRKSNATWIKVQQHLEDTYDVIYRTEEVVIRAMGRFSFIDTAKVQKSPAATDIDVTCAFRELLSDLKYRNTERTREISLADHFETLEEHNTGELFFDFNTGGLTTKKLSRERCKALKNVTVTITNERTNYSELSEFRFQAVCGKERFDIIEAKQSVGEKKVEVFKAKKPLIISDMSKFQFEEQITLQHLDLQTTLQTGLWKDLIGLREPDLSFSRLLRAMKDPEEIMSYLKIPVSMQLYKESVFPCSSGKYVYTAEEIDELEKDNKFDVMEKGRFNTLICDMSTYLYRMESQGSSPQGEEQDYLEEKDIVMREFLTNQGFITKVEQLVEYSSKDLDKEALLREADKSNEDWNDLMEEEDKKFLDKITKTTKRYKLVTGTLDNKLENVKTLRTIKFSKLKVKPGGEIEWSLNFREILSNATVDILSPMMIRANSMILAMMKYVSRQYRNISPLELDECFKSDFFLGHRSSVVTASLYLCEDYLRNEFDIESDDSLLLLKSSMNNFLASQNTQIPSFIRDCMSSLSVMTAYLEKKGYFKTVETLLSGKRMKRITPLSATSRYSAQIEALKEQVVAYAERKIRSAEGFDPSVISEMIGRRVESLNETDEMAMTECSTNDQQSEAAIEDLTVLKTEERPDSILGVSSDESKSSRDSPVKVKDHNILRLIGAVKEEGPEFEELIYGDDEADADMLELIQMGAIDENFMKKKVKFDDIEHFDNDAPLLNIQNIPSTSSWPTETHSMIPSGSSDSRPARLLLDCTEKFENRTRACIYVERMLKKEITSPVNLLKEVGVYNWTVDLKGAEIDSIIPECESTFAAIMRYDLESYLKEAYVKNECDELMADFFIFLMSIRMKLYSGEITLR
uniref:RNA-directed RNA polymerase L n=1 Tax=Frankliniella occidentalis associated peribunyavirus-like virus 2 TaxID=2771468 RepID=A0A7H1D349_9VIRU|nr:putative RNA dependent RNA polymerase [Frankliniella occidentalis associated peribunyavirus-like virus 2]